MLVHCSSFRLSYIASIEISAAILSTVEGKLATEFLIFHLELESLLFSKGLVSLTI